MNLPSRRYSRREFLRQSGCAALGASGIAGALSSLKLVGGAASLSSQLQGVGDYRALVCVFLYGGNDGNNVLIPREGSDYLAYSAGRQGIAVPQDDLLPLNISSDERTWGLHPSLPEVQQLINNDKCAVIANVGTLVAPVTREDWVNKSVALPPQLFSHNDQQVHWQTSVPDSVKKIGWGGRLADLTHAMNENQQLSMSISLEGTNVFQIGQDVFQYQVSRNGSVGLRAYNNLNDSRKKARYDAAMNMLRADHPNIYQREFSTIMDRAVANDALLSAALDAVGEPSTVFPDTRLGAQLKMIARIISARGQDHLNMRRQIFFCSLGGWDTHADQAQDHPLLLAELSACLQAFYDATVELGVSSEVTTFTASDFGRSFGINGDGTDHGWGNHQFVIGDAVRPGMYGQMPVLAVDGPDDTSKGRWIPTISVDEYSATLARWFGVSDSEVDFVLPNLGRFSTRDLGFLNLS